MEVDQGCRQEVFTEKEVLVRIEGAFWENALEILYSGTLPLQNLCFQSD